jgi:hypothetical protein
MLAPLAPFERQFEDQSWQSFLSIRAFENSLGFRSWEYSPSVTPR